MTGADEPKDLTDSFLKAVRNKEWSGTEVDGIIDLSSEKDVELAVNGLHFKYGLVADAATLSALSFTNCVFDAPLKLRNSRIVGDLSLRGCTFNAADDGRPEPRAVDLRGTVVHGSLDIRRSTLKGACRLDRAVVRGNFVVRDDSRIDGATNLTGTVVDSQVDLTGSSFGEIVFSGSTLGSLWIGSRDGVTCTGLYGSDTEVRTYARLSRLQVKAGGRRGRKRLHLEEPGTIAFRSCRFGSLFSTWIVKRYDEQEDGWEEDNCVIAETAFLFTDCHVKGELTLSRLRVGRGEPERALDENGAPLEPAGVTGGGKPWGHVRLDRTQVDGAFLMLSPLSVAHRFELSAVARRKAREKSRRNPMAPKYRAHMRSLSMRDFKASYMDLSGLSLHVCGGDDGDGAIDGCLVADRLEVGSSVTTYAWLVQDPPAADPEVAAELAARPTKVRAFIEVPGAARLRGSRIGELRLAAESFGTTQNSVAHEKGVVLELAAIGQLRVPPRRGDPACSHDNDFPVPLDLSGLTVRHWNFDEDVNAEGTGEVDHYLDFLDNDEKLHREVYRSVAVALRDVGRDEDSEKILYTEETRARWERHNPDRSWPPYPRAGRRGRPRPDWATRRRDFGHDVRHPFEWADRYFLQYRRNPIRLLYLILILLFVSTTFVSSRPSNFELSDSSRLVLENAGPGRNFSAGISWRRSGANLGPDDDHWGLWNAVWMSIRYHVPIVPMVVEDEYVASNDTRLDVGLPLLLEPERWRAPGRKSGRTWFTPEDWFALMSILNWIMWPLLLTFALRRALRAE